MNNNAMLEGSKTIVDWAARVVIILLLPGMLLLWQELRGTRTDLRNLRDRIVTLEAKTFTNQDAALFWRDIDARLDDLERVGGTRIDPDNSR